MDCLPVANWELLSGVGIEPSFMPITYVMYSVFKIVFLTLCPFFFFYLCHVSVYVTSTLFAKLPAYSSDQFFTNLCLIPEYDVLMDQVKILMAGDTCITRMIKLSTQRFRLF